MTMLVRASDYPVAGSEHTPGAHADSARSVAAFLEPLDAAVCTSKELVRVPGLSLSVEGPPGIAHRATEGGLRLAGRTTGSGRGELVELPHYRFTGPGSGDEPMRIGIFATIHGDEPESGLGLIRFLRTLVEEPDAASGFAIEAYPLCNPTGFIDGTRHARGGKDLNREFWRNSPEAEVRFLEAELLRRHFHGIICLHCDDTSHGLYGFLSGRQTGDVLSSNLLEPALRAAEAFLPRNLDMEIDGFLARSGVLSSCYDGVLRAPDGVPQTPFEITFETPQRAPRELQVQAFSAALHAILSEYRLLLAHAANI